MFSPSRKARASRVRKGIFGVLSAGAIALLSVSVIGGGIASASDDPTLRGKELVFRDNFDGKSVDKSKWNVRDNQWSNNELSCDRAGNVTVKDGYLRINPNKPKEPVDCNGTKRNYTSGYIDTIDKHNFKYGTFVMRAKLPTNNGTSVGLWPAFWLYAVDGQGEIDIMENWGTRFQDDINSERRSFVALHGDSENKKSASDWVQIPKNGNTTDFHTYRIDWTPNRIDFFIDGVRVMSKNDTQLKWFDEAYNKPFNMRINLQIGGWAGKPNAKTDFSQKYVIDYVRVYK